MSLVINGRFLTQPLTGVQQYARQFSKYLLEVNNGIKIITPKSHVIKKKEPHIIQIGSFKGHTWEQWILPFYLKKHKHPLLINFCNTAPRYYKPQITTIHDLAFLHYPQTFHPVFSAYYNWLIPSIARNAVKIITVSETIAEEINHYYKIPLSKIRVIYNTAEITPSNHSREYMILSVGTIQPRKNYRLILDAFLRCSQNWRWVIVGGFSSNFRSDKSLIHKLKNHPKIQIIENIQVDELHTLYSKASVLVSASIYEGCNLPVLEAIQHGCPVLVSDIPVHRELYTERAEFFSIDQPEASSELAERINSYSPVYKQPPAPIQKYTMKVQGPELWRIIQKF